jgi:NAD(P)-dependent dehydrogenase (short-subunit alcohol dehydrogenase family)
MRSKISYYKGKTALVTGAAAGIGQWFCLELARRGCRVAALDIQSDTLKDTIKIAERMGKEVLPVCCDVSKKQEMYEAIRSTAEQFGGLDFMFNNAGVVFSKDASIPIADRFERVVDINLKGQIYGSLFALDVMREKGAGHIINIASISGLVPIVSSTAYTASKHGVVGFSLNFRNEAAQYGVEVSIICPSGISTQMMSHVGDHPGLISAEKYAKLILDKLPRRKALLVEGWMAKPMWATYRISPWLFAKLWARA